MRLGLGLASLAVLTACSSSGAGASGTDAASGVDGSGLAPSDDAGEGVPTDSSVTDEAPGAVPVDAQARDGSKDGGGVTSDGGKPGLAYGADIHANADYGNGTAAAVDAQFQLMQSRALTWTRLGGVPATSTNALTQTWLSAGQAHGIAMSFMLDIAWLVCPNDATTFASNDATTIHDTTYQATQSFVTPLRNSITDWELGNEIDLKAGQSQPPGNWNHGWAASEWKNVSANGSPDYFTNWAAAIKGAADAIADINKQYGTHLRRILNTTGTHTGFLDFMAQYGVGYEVISYHYYYSNGTSPYALAASPPGSASNSWDLFAGLGAYKRPVTINEMNCAEIYSSGYQNTATDPLYATCLTNLRTQLGYIEHQKEMKLESVCAYELLDEPSAAPPENRFGMYWNMGNGSYAPKAHLYLWSAFAGGTLTSAEQAVLSGFGLLPLP